MLTCKNEKTIKKKKNLLLTLKFDLLVRFSSKRKFITPYPK